MEVESHSEGTRTTLKRPGLYCTGVTKLVTIWTGRVTSDFSPATLCRGHIDHQASVTRLKLHVWIFMYGYSCLDLLLYLGG